MITFFLGVSGLALLVVDISVNGLQHFVHKVIVRV